MIRPREVYLAWFDFGSRSSYLGHDNFKLLGVVRKGVDPKDVCYDMKWQSSDKEALRNNELDLWKFIKVGTLEEYIKEIVMKNVFDHIESSH